MTINGDKRRKAFADRVEKRMRATRQDAYTVAKATGAHHNRVREWARGSRWPSVAHLGPLAVALGVSVDWLLTGGGQQPKASVASPREQNALAIARELYELSPQIADLARRAKEIG